MRGDRSIAELATAFYARTLPRADWTHPAHLRVALWTVLHAPAGGALARLRAGIWLFNEACGVPNTDESGYHETVTGFYVRLISAFVARADPGLTPGQMADELIRRHGEKTLPLRYWSRNCLMSAGARACWVEPDVRRFEWLKPSDGA